jgi:hypothetical protein
VRLWSRPKTDREVLACIYRKHIHQYPKQGDPFVALDLEALAKELGMPEELLFARLFHHLRHKYRFTETDARGKQVLTQLFDLSIEHPLQGFLRHPIHFPLLVGVLASLEYERRSALITRALSIIAIVVAVYAAAVKGPSSTTSNAAAGGSVEATKAPTKP